MKNLFKTVIPSLILGLAASVAMAQAPGQGPGQGGGRRGFDPEEMRARMMERFQEQLKASDEEWKVLQPLVENVMTKQRESGMGRMGMFFGGMRGGPPRGGDDQANRPDDRRADRRGADRMGPPPEVEALQTALESDSTPAAELKSKMAAVRASRQKADTELKQAREELRKVLTVRQEAQLVLMGVLD